MLEIAVCVLEYFVYIRTLYRPV